MTPLRRRMLEELHRRNYSPETTRGYILAVKQFAEYFGESPETLRAEEIRHFQLYLLNGKKLAPGTVETRMAALRFLYKKVLKRRDLAYDDLIFPETPEKLPREPGSKSGPARTLSGTVLPPICWKQALICGPSSCCWAIGN